MTRALSRPAHFLDGDFRNTGLTWQLSSTFLPTPALTCGGVRLGHPGLRLAQPGHWLGRWVGRGGIKRAGDRWGCGHQSPLATWLPTCPTALTNKQGLPDTPRPGLRRAPGVTRFPPAWPWGSLSPSLGWDPSSLQRDTHSLISASLPERFLEHLLCARHRLRHGAQRGTPENKSDKRSRN